MRVTTDFRVIAKRQWPTVIIVALGLTSLVLVVNLSARGMLLWGADEWNTAVTLHASEAPFSLRPLATFLLKFAANVFALSYRTSFIITQYTALFLFFSSSAVLFFQYGFTRREALWGMALLAGTFPILCAHFEPNFIWDDFWMFTGLIWTSVFILQKRIFPAALAYSFAALNHEAALILFPGFFFLTAPELGTRRIIPPLLAIAVYFAYRMTFFPEILPGRFTRLLVNFANWGETRQSLYSLFVSFGWLWALAGAATIHSLRRGHQESQQLWRRTALAGFCAVILGVSVMFFAALARETRLLFLPFPFLAPLGLWALTCEPFSGMRRMRNSLRSWPGLATAAGLLITAIALSVLLFPSFPYLPMIDFHRVFFGLNLAAAIFFLLQIRSEDSGKCDSP